MPSLRSSRDPIHLHAPHAEYVLGLPSVHRMQSMCLVSPPCIACRVCAWSALWRPQGVHEHTLLLRSCVCYTPPPWLMAMNTCSLLWRRLLMAMNTCCLLLLAAAAAASVRWVPLLSCCSSSCMGPTEPQPGAHAPYAPCPSTAYKCTPRANEPQGSGLDELEHPKHDRVRPSSAEGAAAALLQ